MEIKSFYNSRLNEKMQYTVHSSGLRVYEMCIRDRYKDI